MASGDVVSVQFAGMEAAKESLIDKYRQLEGALGNLSHALKPLNDTWAASGSVAGQQAFAAQRQLFVETEALMGLTLQFAERIDNACVSQRDLDKRTANLFA